MHAQGLDGSATPEVAGGIRAASAAAADPALRHPRRVTGFRSRRSALTEAQQEVWGRLWPRLGRAAVDGAPGDGAPNDGAPTDGAPAQPLDPAAWFGRADARGASEGGLICEIGCGTGTSTLAMARAEPDLDVIAVEVYRRGLAQLLSGIDRSEQQGDPVTNIRLIRGDGVDVLEHLLCAGSLTGVRVFFPDPWPKARHHKRRLLQPATVALIADRLRPGGVLHAATDHPGYAEQIAEVGDAEPRLRRARSGEALPISIDRPPTKYETKARHAGSTVTEFVWVKAAT